MRKSPKLPTHYHFAIEVLHDTKFGKWCKFYTIGGGRLTEARFGYRLTPSQWRRARAFLTRDLVPFLGYDYKVKDSTPVGVIRITA